MSIPVVDHIECAARTAGQWATEADALAALDDVLERVGLFVVHKEVCGQLVQPRPCQAERTVRVDRVLTPMSRLREAGWHHGAIGIEAKRSGEKVGPPLAQMVDYGRSLFALSGGVRVWLDFVFLWPLPMQHGAIASFMAQNRLGSAWCHDGRLELFSGQDPALLRAWPNGRLIIGPGLNGKRTGSR